MRVREDPFAADEVLRGDRLLAHGAVVLRDRDGDGDVVAVVDVTGHRVAEADVDVVVALRAAVELAVDERLDEAELARPAEGLARRVVGHHDLALAVDESHDVVRDRVRDDLVGQPHRLDRAHRLVV
nr:hypothetical protein [Janibacter melonis]